MTNIRSIVDNADASDASMDEIMTSIDQKIRLFETDRPKLFPSDSELAKCQENHERLKKATILELRDLQNEFEKKLEMAKRQYEKDLAFAERLHAEKINQMTHTHSAEIADAVKDYKEEIEYLQMQLEELSNQKKRDKFQKLKNFFFRQMREAKKKVQLLNAERAHMKAQIKSLRRDLERLRGRNSGGDGLPNFNQFTKLEIQIFAQKDDEQKTDLISRSNEIKHRLDTLDEAGYTDKIITEIVNEYSRIEMVLNNFKQYNVKRKILKN